MSIKHCTYTSHPSPPPPPTPEKKKEKQQQEQQKSTPAWRSLRPTGAQVKKHDHFCHSPILFHLSVSLSVGQSVECRKLSFCSSIVNLKHPPTPPIPPPLPRNKERKATTTTTTTTNPKTTTTKNKKQNKTEHPCMVFSKTDRCTLEETRLILSLSNPFPCVSLSRSVSLSSTGIYIFALLLSIKHSTYTSHPSHPSPQKRKKEKKKATTGTTKSTLAWRSLRLTGAQVKKPDHFCLSPTLFLLSLSLGRSVCRV